MFSSKLVLCVSLLTILSALADDRPPIATQQPCQENEIYRECGPSCDTVCSLLGKTCTINFIRCPDGCYCREGYARDENYKCVDIKKCRA